MPRFVVQEHDASRLHWDFRLEMDGVLKSWAVPKGPPVEPGVKRLAVEVEDHPLDYIDFEGVIEEGYGAGTVEIWDKGTYEINERKEKVIVFRLDGGQLKGRYRLIFTGYGGGKGWLLIKGKERAAEAGGPVGATLTEEPAPRKRGAKKAKKAGRQPSRKPRLKAGARGARKNKKKKRP